MFCDIGEPELVRPGRHEPVTLTAVLVDDEAEIVMNGGARLLAVLAPLLPEHAPPGVRGRDPPRGPIRHRLAHVAGFVSEEPISELRVVTVSIEQRVRPIRLLQLPPRHRITQPAVVGLASELQYPARHHDRNPVRGELAHERVHHFPGR